MLLNIQIITEYPLWLIVFCLLLGVIYSFFLYRKEEKFNDLSLWLIRLMAFFRFALVSVLAFLLLSPYLKTVFNKTEKPIVVIAQDNSGSILLNKDSIFYLNDYLQQIQKLKDELEKKYEVRSYIFGDEVVEGNKIDYSQKVTDISNLFDEVQNKFYNRNVGALILASDGIFNQGANPVFNSNETDFPIFTIALGDTAIQRDISISEVNYNRITFLDNQFPIEVYADIRKCGQFKTDLTVYHNGKELFKKGYDVKSDKFTVSEKIVLDAKEIGVQHYKVKFSSVEGEISVVNNSRDIYIEVLDGRQNVLLLGNAPHPDMKALKLSIESNENYKVTTAFYKDFDFNLEPYSLVIAHQIPADFYQYYDKLKEATISVLYILGNQTDVSTFNSLNVGLNISSSLNQFNQVLPLISASFPLFTLSEGITKMISSSSPLVAPFGSYQLEKNGYTLFNQKIGSVETTSPLAIFFQENINKTAVIAGEGIWRWRMQEFAENHHHYAFNELINKMIQFLSVKDDKSKFRIISKSQFLENEEVLFNAELYNASYELINDPNITIEFIDNNGNRYNYLFNKTTSSYILNAGILPVGFYNYTAKVDFGGKEYMEKGQFQIDRLLIEAINTLANHQLLQNISEKFGGALFYPSNMNKIVSKIEDNENITAIIYEKKDLKELINLKWIFFLLLFFLGMEWFLRKRNGSY